MPAASSIHHQPVNAAAFAHWPGCQGDPVSSATFCVRENSPRLQALLRAEEGLPVLNANTPCAAALIYKESEKSPTTLLGARLLAFIGRHVREGRGTHLSSAFPGWVRPMNYVEGNHSVGLACPREDEDMV